MERSTVQSEYYGPHDDIVDLYKGNMPSDVDMRSRTERP